MRNYLIGSIILIFGILIGAVGYSIISMESQRLLWDVTEQCLEDLYNFSVEH